jgi:hypothetical protein
MGGFRMAMGSDELQGGVKEAQDHRWEIDQTKDGASGPYSSWNVYLEWNKASFFRRQIFKELIPEEDPNQIPFFPQSFIGETEPDNKYTLLNEGENPFYDAAQKELIEPQRDWKGIGRDTAFLLGYQAAICGILYFLPESVTQWTDEQKKATVNKWWENVRNPVWDKDKFWINYIAHPYWGATYYIRARERGFGEFGSFWYSALLSALYEFGIEAFFEPPSKTDLIVTPVGGYVVGKFIFEPIRDNIKVKTQLAWYDHAVLILTDPLGALNSVFERALGIQSDIRVQFHSPPRKHMAAAPAGGSQEGQEVRFFRPEGVSLQLQVEWK